MLAGEANACFSWDVTCNDRSNNVDRDDYTIYTIQVDMSPGCRNQYWLYFDFDGIPSGWDAMILDQTGHEIPVRTEFHLSGTVTYYFSAAVFAPPDGGNGETAYVTVLITADDRYNQNDTEEVETSSVCNGVVSHSPSDTTLVVTNTTTSTVSLSWDQVADTDFRRYEIHQSNATDFIPVMTTNIHEITSRSTTTYVVEGLSAGSSYYFRVRVVDNEGSSTGGPYFTDSNEGNGTTTGVNYPPLRVNITQSWDTENNNTMLEWEVSEEEDFRMYRFFSHHESGYKPGASFMVLDLYEKAIDSARISGLWENKTNYIILRVVDQGGMYNDSEEFSVLTEDWLPERSRITEISEVTDEECHLNWTSAGINDFDRYELHLSTESGYTPDGGTLTVTEKDQRYNFTDVEDLEYYTTYYAMVRTYDKGGNYADSPEEFEFRTEADGEAPDPVTINVPGEGNVTDDEIRIDWTESTSNDYQNYTVFRGNISGFDPDDDSVIVLHTSDRKELDVLDEDLEDYTNYYYIVRVHDVEDLVSDSDEMEVMTQHDGEEPEAVVLEDPEDEDITSDSVDLNWSRCTSNDFLSYEVYYSTEKNFDIETEGTMERNITSRYVGTETVSDLLSETKYYFKVRTWDNEGMYADSNEVNAETEEPPPDEQPPEPVVLETPTEEDIDYKSVKLNWSKNDNSDFDRYEVHMSTESGFDPDSGTLEKTITDRTDTNVKVSGLDAETEYFFVVRTWDNEEPAHYADSNQKRAVTEEVPESERDPDGVTIQNPFTPDIEGNSIVVRWTENENGDFDLYEVHMSEYPGFTPESSTKVGEIDEQETTSYTVTGLVESTDYHFIVRVIDTQERSADSPEVMITTLNNPPSAVTINLASSITKVSFDIRWTECEDVDFERYEVHVSTYSGFNPGDSTHYDDITRSGTTVLVVVDLEPDTEYYVVIVVVDSEGAETESNEYSVMTQRASGSGGGGGDTPGFELVVVSTAMIVAGLMVRRRRP